MLLLQPSGFHNRLLSWEESSNGMALFHQTTLYTLLVYAYAGW